MKRNNQEEKKVVKDMVEAVAEAFYKSNEFEANELYHVLTEGLKERAEYWANLGRKVYTEDGPEYCKHFFDKSDEFERLSEKVSKIYFYEKDV